MKRALIVFAHPEPRSLNAFLKARAVSILKDKSYTVTVSDLYGENFKSRVDKLDYPFYGEEPFNVLKASAIANQLNQFPSDVVREKQRLTEADLILFQFPIWWYSAPSVLHAYFEKMLIPGWAFGTDTPALKDKKVLISVTTGGKEEEYQADRRGTIAQILYPIIFGSLKYCNMSVYEPLAVYNTIAAPEDERIKSIARWESELKNFEKREVIP